MIRAIEEHDRGRLAAFVREHWGAPVLVAHGIVYEVARLPAFVAVEDDEWVGCISYIIKDGDCEIVSLDSLREGRGIGSALIKAVKEVAERAGCRRLWLITTNDNLHALRFYQKRGFALMAIHRGAVDLARHLKPEIPLIGNDGIPLRDEIELEMDLQAGDRAPGEIGRKG
ncbi:GNAT family N-acetyltransferase [Dictyobacter aurantiacus]|uniref:N-acetyltransferase n=1 Tax=Dictyobacter aurantiacus TaxID=1936993 RepID=A0A401ZFQ8_9CHLR|nr:GNAT family N-acetyltransferase [Dictyobacter aurantiacus]GCE05730.1 N-acetyltransferase [Dictyobacter aurantiacus]